MRVEHKMNLFRWKILRALRGCENGEADTDMIAFETGELARSVSHSLRAMERLGLTRFIGTRRLKNPRYGYHNYSVYKLTKTGYQLLASHKET